MASVNLDDFADLHRDKHTGLLYTTLKQGRRVLLCSLSHFLPVEEPRRSLSETNALLIKRADTWLADMRKTGVSNLQLDRITDKHGGEWLIVDRKTALVFFREAPAEQVQQRYSQLCSVLKDDLVNAPLQLDLAKQVGCGCLAMLVFSNTRFQ